MPHVMICRGDAAGLPCESEGMYLRECDHEAHGGMGEVTWTSALPRAKRFDGMDDALEFWGRVPKNHPVREMDGLPNKPLTAFHVEIVPLPIVLTKTGLMVACEPCATKNSWQSMTSFGTMAECCCCGEVRYLAVVRNADWNAD